MTPVEQQQRHHLQRVRLDMQQRPDAYRPVKIQVTVRRLDANVVIAEAQGPDPIRPGHEQLLQVVAKSEVEAVRAVSAALDRFVEAA